MRTSIKPKASTFGKILLVMSLLVFGMAGLVAPASAGGGYPDDDAVDCSSQFGIYSWCKNGTWLSSRNYGYRNCTDWVAYRLMSQGITNHVSGRGNGKDWDDSSTGVTITTTPEVGDAAVWNSGGGGFGHVAYVEEIRPKAGGGYEARVSEYNQAGTGMYTDTRWVVADDYVDFNGVGTPLGGGSSAGGGAHGTTTLGVMNPGTETFYLRNSNSPGNAEITLQYGNAGWVPLAGDWFGEGRANIGVYNPATSTFYLRNSAGSTSTIQYGNTGWVPIMGDWDGNGTVTLGVFNPANATFYLQNTNVAGNATITLSYGNSGWVPLAGDWFGEGRTNVGVYDPVTSTFYLRNSAGGTTTVQYGNAGWTPIVGDWDGSGTVTVGIYNPATSTFYLRNSNSAGLADLTVQYGNANWVPIVGDWNGV